MSKEGARSALTSEQQIAVDLRGVSVALSSGAGCGKTTVLTERYLRELEQGSLDSIVALTFTDKAAAEMRSRIRRVCRGHASTDSTRTRWRSVLRQLEACRVSTFHRFCRELIDRFSIEAGVPPGSEVLLEQVAPTLRDEALSASIRGWLQSADPDFEALAVEFSIGEVREAIRGAFSVRSSGRLAYWATLSPEELLEHWEMIWNREGQRAVLEEVHPVAASTLAVLDRANFDDPKASGIVGPLLLDLQQIIEGEYDDPVALLSRIQQKARVQGTQAKNWPSIEYYENVKTIFEKLRGQVKKSIDRLTIDPERTRRAAEHGCRFARLASEAIEEYGRRKRKAEWLDFDDLIVKARELLIDRAPEIRAKISDEVQLVLVDEFQDTDELQFEILQAIAGREAPHGRLFLVGDSKQAIYSFRGTRPGIFQDARATFPRAGHRALSTNFRSVSGILNFVNALFADSELDQPDHTPLMPGVAVSARSVPLRPDHPPPVEFFWDESEPEGQEHKLGRRRVEDRRWEEAARIARLLAERLDQGWPIWADEARVWRNASAGDIALLFRAMTDVAPYEAALSEAGLNFHTTGGSGFFARQEVLDIVNLLATLEDPLDPLALAAILRSPFFGLSDVGLYWLSVTVDDDSPPMLVRNLDREILPEGLSRADRRRALRARSLLRKWRNMKDRVPIAALLKTALSDTAYEAVLLAQPQGVRRRANIQKLVRLARDYDRAGFGLADLAARLRQDFRRLSREDEAATTVEGVDAVRLLTIHAAKGLEFPIVVLPDLDRRPHRSFERFQIDSKLGPIVHPEELPEAETTKSNEGGNELSTVLSKVLSARVDRAESLRLFYVATTRAANHLILSAATTAETLNASSNPIVRLLAERFDLTEGTLLARLPAGWNQPVVRRVELGGLRRVQAESTGQDIPQRPESNPSELLRVLRSRPSRLLESPRLRAPIPKLLDLDAPIGRAMSACRVDSLVSSVLGSLAMGEQSSVGELAKRIGSSFVPAMPSRQIEEAVHRLEKLLTFVPLANAVRSGATVGHKYRVIHTMANGNSIALVGTLDIQMNSPEGGLTVFALTRPGVPLEWAGLRLRAATQSLPLATSSRSRAWLLTSEGTGLEDHRSLDQLLGEVLELLSNGGTA
jgi:ATP-dependent helicase/nuclease subunit A